jgi:hypothetical protein
MHRWLLVLSLAACSPNATPAPVDPPVYEPARAPASTSPPTSTAPPPTAGSSGSAKPGRGPLAHACTADADCVWEDPCVPRACVVKGAVKPTACDESLAPDGSCSCVEGVCSKKPKNPVAATGTCEVRGCIVDPGRGQCITDTGGVAEGLRTDRHLNEGPSCDCINPASGCQFNWFDAVPCKSELDCWISHDPRARPVPRPKNMRRPFRPCKDGETAPVCEAGKCRVGPHYKC